jgi:tetratricopeptide (TPR) repeat protein
LSHLVRAGILEKLGRLGEALEAATRACELRPEQLLSLFVRADYLFRLGQLEEADRAYARVLEIDPNHIRALASRGGVLSNLGRHEEGLKLTERALELDDSLGQAHLNRSITLAHLGRSEESLKSADRAAELLAGAPAVAAQLAYASNSVAWMRAMSSDPGLRDSAVALARRATELAPDRQTYWNTYGIALYRAGKWNDALGILDRSIALGGDAYDWFFVAMAKHRLGSEDARAAYDKAVAWMERQAPGDEELKRFRAEAEDLLGIRKGGAD